MDNDYRIVDGIFLLFVELLSVGGKFIIYDGKIVIDLFLEFWFG